MGAHSLASRQNHHWVLIGLCNEDFTQWYNWSLQSSHGAKGYTQIFGLDYGETFSHVIKIIFVGFANHSMAWCNLLLLGSTILAQFCLSLVWLIVKPIIRFFHFILHLTWASILLYILMTLSPIMIRWHSLTLSHFHIQFHAKSLGPFRYFIGIKVAQSSSSIVISGQKYSLDILTEPRLVWLIVTATIVLWILIWSFSQARGSHWKTLLSSA